MTALLNPAAWIGAAAGAGLMLAWAVFWHGPAQYDAGAVAKAAQLDRATNEAAKELADEAERHSFLWRQCRARAGGMYDFERGLCLEGSAD